MDVSLYLIAAVLIGGVALAKVAESIKFPYPIVLILAGMVLQLLPLEVIPEGLGLEFIAQLTLAAVVFYAGLTMNLKETQRSRNSIVLLATLGVLLTSIFSGMAVSFFSGSMIALALLIGAIVSPTDPAALFSVLESGGVRVKRKLFTLLEGEAVLNDATADSIQCGQRPLTQIVFGHRPMVRHLAGLCPKHGTWRCHWVRSCMGDWQTHQLLQRGHKYLHPDCYHSYTDLWDW